MTRNGSKRLYFKSACSREILKATYLVIKAIYQSSSRRPTSAHQRDLDAVKKIYSISSVKSSLTVRRGGNRFGSEAVVLVVFGTPLFLSFFRSFFGLRRFCRFSGRFSDFVVFVVFLVDLRNYTRRSICLKNTTTTYPTYQLSHDKQREGRPYDLTNTESWKESLIPPTRAWRIVVMH